VAGALITPWLAARVRPVPLILTAVMVAGAALASIGAATAPWSLALGFLGTEWA